jgi:radical SAM protein with 4Fe4S-binding SPASM domain
MARFGDLDNIVWELTLRCNARCLHCGSSAGSDRPNNLNEDEIMRVCDELAEAKCKKVTLIGGEAFLHPSWRKIVERLSSRGIWVAVVTNGLFLDEEKIKFFSENQTDCIGISLDGSTPEIHDKIRNVPGIFNRIFALDGLFKKYKIPVVAISTITNMNVLEMPKLFKLLSTSFFDGWQIQVGSPYGRMQEDLGLNELEYYIVGIFIALAQRRIKSSKLEVFGMHDVGYYSDVIPDSVSIAKDKWDGCPAGKYVMGIRSDGKVTGCLSIYNDKFLEADLRKKSVKDIWCDDDFGSWNKRYNRVKTLTGYCKECPFSAVCCAGCSSCADAYYGTVGENRLCFRFIEHKYKDIDAKDEFSAVLKDLTNGKILKSGVFKLRGNKRIDDNYINKIKDKYIRQLLSMIK